MSLIGSSVWKYEDWRIAHVPVLSPAIVRWSCNSAFIDIFPFEFEVVTGQEDGREREIVIAKPLSPNSESPGAMRRL